MSSDMPTTVTLLIKLKFEFKQMLKFVWSFNNQYMFKCFNYYYDWIIIIYYCINYY